MTVQRDVVPDFRNPKICECLHQTREECPTYEAFRDGIASRAQEGYSHVDTRILPASQNKILFTFRRTTCDLLSPAGRIVRSVQIVDPIEHRLRLEIVALLFLKTGIDAAIEQTIRTAFSTTDVAVDPIDDIEARIIRSGAISAI